MRWGTLPTAYNSAKGVILKIRPESLAREFAMDDDGDDDEDEDDDDDNRY